jgi:flagellar assembly protein FliH
MSSLSDRPPAPPSPDKPGANAYSRFIPREELSSFSAWQPGAFGDTPAASTARRPPPPPPAEPPPPSPQALAQLKAARDGGYQDGYRDGLAALESFKQTYSAQVSAQVGAVVQALQAQFDVLERDLAQRVAGVALQLARQVVRDELKSHPGHVVAVAHEALSALLVTARHVSLRLHPEDQALVASGAAEALAARGARLVADARIARSGCVVESDIGSIDAQVAARWQRAAATLGQESSWVEPGPEGTEGASA